MATKFRVTLTDEEREQLWHLVKQGKKAARKLTHARILLLADQSPAGPAKTDQQIAEVLGCGVRTLERVRKRFVEESFESALNPRPQPPRPESVKIKGEVEAQLIKLACSDPPEGRSRWTLQLLAGEMVALGILDNISPESVRKALKKTTSSPGSSRRGASRRRRMASSCIAWRTC